MQSLLCPFAFIILEKCWCGFFFPLWLEGKPPSNLSWCVLGIFRAAKTLFEKFCLQIARATSFPSLLKPGLWKSSSFRQNFVSTLKHPNKRLNSVSCSLDLNESTQWAASGLLRSGNWGNHSPESCLKSFDCLVEADLPVKLPHSQGWRDGKARYQDKADNEVLMKSPKHNSFPAGAHPESFTSGKPRF